MTNLSIEELRRGRLDESTYWGRRTFLRSGRGWNDYCHFIVPLIRYAKPTPNPGSCSRRQERRAPTHSRIQVLLPVLELFEGHADRAVARADAPLASQPARKPGSSGRTSRPWLTHPISKSPSSR